MKKNVYKLLGALTLTGSVAISMPSCSSQFDMSRAMSAAAQTAQALSLTDEQMAAYVHETVAQMDKENKVAPANSAYTKRLAKLTKGITNADGVPLNFKVYEVADVNAFACPDGSVRVFSGLMDIMDDDELMGVVGHEIGHVIKRHSKNAFKNQLLAGAARDALASSSSAVAALTDSQLASLGQALINARYSQKQEKEADNCGYDFLVANKRNPWGMVEAFEKMQKMEQQAGGSNSYLQKMFSSHPDTADRIKAMTKRCVADGYKRK